MVINRAGIEEYNFFNFNFSFMNSQAITTLLKFMKGALNRFKPLLFSFFSLVGACTSIEHAENMNSNNHNKAIIDYFETHFANKCECEKLLLSFKKHTDGCLETLHKGCAYAKANPNITRLDFVTDKSRHALVLRGPGVGAYGWSDTNKLVYTIGESKEELSNFWKKLALSIYQDEIVKISESAKIYSIGNTNIHFNNSKQNPDILNYWK